MVAKAGFNAKAEALKALNGVGDRSLGEWFETHKAFHVKRRLSMTEQIASGLTTIDLRGTDHGYRLLHNLVRVVPAMKQFAMREFAP